MKSSCKVPEEVTEDWYFKEFQSRNYCYYHKLSLSPSVQSHTNSKTQRPPCTFCFTFILGMTISDFEGAHLVTLNMKLLTLINNITSAKTLRALTVFHLLKPVCAHGSLTKHAIYLKTVFDKTKISSVRNSLINCLTVLKFP